MKEQNKIKEKIETEVNTDLRMFVYNRDSRKFMNIFNKHSELVINKIKENNGYYFRKIISIIKEEKLVEFLDILKKYDKANCTDHRRILLTGENS